MKTYKYILQLVVLSLIFSMSAQAQNANEIFRAAGSPHNPKVQISFNKYYTAEGLAAISKKIADAYPNLVKRQSIGKSTEGRNIWMLAITNYKVGNANKKPGFYIDGNIHSNEIQGAEISTYPACYLT
jgi:hypothetical protein